MRSFSYYLYENFDADRVVDHPGNPRRVLNASADAILSRVADFPPRACPAALLREEFGPMAVERLIAAGALREKDGRVAYDTPVFLAEDVPALKSFFTTAAVPLADRLWDRREALWEAAGAIQNGFDAKTNLYHILCGMIFDGCFFDWLGERGAVAVSRPHASGLDYLSVIYEDCEGLRAFSDKILCSYNRLTDGAASLQSFGDADGDRFDLYRCFRLREQGPLPERFREAGALLDKLPKGEERRIILQGARSLLQGKECQGDILAILELFEYVESGKICVPVFSDTPAVGALAALVEECLYAEVERALLEARENLELTAVRHGVPPKETANELYHVLFGGVNEEIVKRGLTAAPPRRPGEGRYLRCIEW
ncbi:MAG: hypothetical protein K2N78_03975 [Oscillospiraceae bacterium]|nr:hypothetical protein [Oscillospiraceae bacterium]